MISLLVSAQIVEHTYHFENPVVNEIQGYNQLQFEGCMQTALEGNPSLPYKAVSLLLPNGSEAESVEVIFSDFEEIKMDRQLYPYQSARPYSQPERIFIKKYISKRKSWRVDNTLSQWSRFCFYIFHSCSI